MHIRFKKSLAINSDKSFAQIAQLVEQRTENPRVAGSIPALGTFLLSEKIKIQYLIY